MAVKAVEDIPDIDESQLESSENAEMFVFQYLASTEYNILHSSATLLKSKQASIEKRLLSITTSPLPPPANASQPQKPYLYPPPGRAIRNAVGRSLVALYTRGETRTLFDTLQSYVKAVEEPPVKGVDRDSWKIAAFSCIGGLMAVFGAQYMSLVSDITTVALRTHKSSHASPLLRYHALKALQNTVKTAKRAVTEAVLKDILKSMKYALSDKCLAIQRAAADVLVTVFAEPQGITSSDVDTILSLCVKSLDGTDRPTRRSFALLVAHMLKSTQVERTHASDGQSAKKDQAKSGANKNADDDDDESPSGAAVPAAESLKPLKTPQEMLSCLSLHFNKQQMSRKSRVGIFEFYSATLASLGANFVEKHYTVIVGHFMNDIIAHPSGVKSRYEILLVRHLVGILLRDLVGVRMLSEQGQILAIRELANLYLKRWPAMMPGQVAPRPEVLVVALKEVAGLVLQLGNAPPPVQDALSEPLVALLAHPSHSVRVNASWTLRCFCHSTPLRLPRAIITAIELLQRDVSLLTAPASSSTSSDIHLRALGHAYGLSALISTIPSRPLYVSYDLPAKVLDMAVSLLKRAGEHDAVLASTEVEVAWICIASLMSLGPNFVRPHLPQLLVLWRNALPKPTTKEAGERRDPMQWEFLLHVRESALGAVLCFLKYNAGTLVTLDVARRIASILGNALSFANTFLTQVASYEQHPGDEGSTISNTAGHERGLSSRGREALLRRRVFDCFSALVGFSSITDSTQASLLQAASSLFAGPDTHASSVQASIAASSGSFTSVWQSTDGYAYGVTSIEVLDDAGIEGEGEKQRAEGDPVEVALDRLLHQPVLGACEHDTLFLCELHASMSGEYRIIEPVPPATAVVDTAIKLYAQLLPSQDLASTIRVVNSSIESVQSPKFDKNPARKAAVVINTIVAIVYTLRAATNSHFRHAKETLGHSQVATALSTFLKNSLIDGDLVLRFSSSESLGRLSSLAGTNFLTSQIKQLVDQVVSNRDPNGRAGCALAFGAIYTHVGGLSAGALLKTIVNVLMSLSNDPHPVVHYWALRALSRVISAASLSYAPFVSSTLGMLLKVYLMNSHEPEGGTVNNTNMSGDDPAYPVVCQIIDAVITVLGPDLQDSHRTRTLVLNLVWEFSMEEDERISVDALQCFQHILMFSPEHVDITDLVNRFRKNLSSPRRPLKRVSINGLYQLVQKDAVAMSKLGGDKLVEDLFSMLDEDSSVEGVRDVISGWLQQTVIHNPSAWIDLCQRIMSRSTASQDAAMGQGNLRDDEGESLSVGITQDDAPTSGRTHSISRWRTQLFALQCLHQICTTVASSGRREHIDTLFARANNIHTSTLLFSRVSDLIKMAFTASTAYVTEIRLEGLIVLQDVIQIFALSPDPAFDDALLLEQHQAPITAALTPAFSTDSTPEILASAVKACAVFVGCGVVKDVDRMGRILKLLISALEQSQGSGMFALGESGEVSPNASSMLRISTLSAWAELQIASVQHAYLVNVVKPHRSILCSLWISALRDYAGIRIDSEFLQDGPGPLLDPSYSSLGKEVLFPYYEASWPVLLRAAATAMEARDPAVLAAMNGRELSSLPQASNNSSIHDEPTAFFFVLFGIIYEALSNTSVETVATPVSRQFRLVACLDALKHLVRPEYSGRAMFEPTIFEEFISLCYRLALTEAAIVQIHLLGVLSSIVRGHIKYLLDSTADVLASTSLTAHCLRIYSHIIRHSMSGSSRIPIQGEPVDRVKMISAAFAAFREVALLLPSSQREDVRGVGVLLYSELLKDEISDLDFVAPTLPMLKGLLDIPTHASAESEQRFGKLAHGLISACLLNVDEMRGREGLIAARKIKNNLLAAVLVLTLIPPNVKVGQAAVEHCCFLISQKLQDEDEICLTATHCAKTLIKSAASGNILLRQCYRHLIPGLIEHIARLAPAVSDGSISERQASSIGEVWNAFSAFFSSVPEDLRSPTLGVLLPTMILLLSQPGSSAIKTQTVTQLLSYATQCPVAFKEATGKLDAEMKDLLEQSVRRALGGAPGTASTQSSVKPQISLRSF